MIQIFFYVFDNFYLFQLSKFEICVFKSLLQTLYFKYFSPYVSSILCYHRKLTIMRSLV